MNSLKGLLLVVHKNGKLYGIPFTSMSVLFNSLKICAAFSMVCRGPVVESCKYI